MYLLAERQDIAEHLFGYFKNKVCHEDEFS